ncbi:MAG: hypothetical protein RR934_05855 [Gordonibacter sp.]|uniref:hypothetical protein n=1 Tax=Gordonibacter sp. TaxID=1968902 RepID=UPI003220337E
MVWNNPVVLGMLGVAVIALAWFIVRQLRLTIPLLEFRVFASRGFTTSMIVVVLALIATLMLSQLNASHGFVYIAAVFAVLKVNIWY